MTDLFGQEFNLGTFVVNTRSAKPTMALVVGLNEDKNEAQLFSPVYSNKAVWNPETRTTVYTTEVSTITKSESSQRLICLPAPRKFSGVIRRDYYSRYTNITPEQYEQHARRIYEWRQQQPGSKTPKLPAELKVIL